MGRGVVLAVSSLSHVFRPTHPLGNGRHGGTRCANRSEAKTPLRKEVLQLKKRFHAMPFAATMTVVRSQGLPVRCVPAVAKKEDAPSHDGHSVGSESPTARVWKYARAPEYPPFPELEPPRRRKGRSTPMVPTNGLPAFPHCRPEGGPAGPPSGIATPLRGSWGRKDPENAGAFRPPGPCG